MITVFGIRPAWGLPCVSPYVTKLVFWLRMNGLPFDLQPQNPVTLATDSPNGKLPYVVLPGGERVADSAVIIEQLGRQHAAPLEAGLTQDERASAIAWTQLLDGHIYWHGVIGPRWVDEAQWPRYRAVLFGAGELAPPVLSLAQAYRSRVVAQWQSAVSDPGPLGAGSERAVAGVQALEAQIRMQAFLLGSAPRSIDAAAAAFLAHLIDAPFDSEAASAARASAAIKAFRERIRELMAD